MIPLSDPALRHRTFPIVNLSLVVACSLVFLYELSLGPSGREAFFYRYGLIPRELTGEAKFVPVFTSMFVHGSISHFGFNMLFLWVFGDNVEDRMGHLPYLLFYLFAGVVAVAAQVFVDPYSDIPVIGASGAIAGALGGYFILYPFHKIRTLVIFFFITFFDIPAIFLLGFWIVMQFFGGLGSLGTSAQGGVAYFAHIGGFMTGVLVIGAGKVLFWRERFWPQRRRDDWWRGRRL